MTTYVLHGDSEGDPDEDERYVSGYVVELDRWVRDLVGGALPPELLCRDDCRGLCPRCGADLNVVGDDHHHERGVAWAPPRRVYFPKLFV